MISYQTYKIVHFIFLFLLVTALSASFTQRNPPKWASILNGVSSLMILVSGMGLLARIGIAHGAGFPVWVTLKMVIWLVIAAAGAILAKRLNTNRGWVLGGLLFLIMLNIFFAVLKPV